MTHPNLSPLACVRTNSNDSAIISNGRGGPEAVKARASKGTSLKALRRLFLTLLLLSLSAPAFAQAALPRMVTKNGRHTLLVDEAPFLMLGAQVTTLAAVLTAFVAR